jgi:hypothetical protein
MPYIADIPERPHVARVVKVKYLGPTTFRGARLKAYFDDLTLTQPYEYEQSWERQAMELAVKAVIAWMKKLDKQIEARSGRPLPPHDYNTIVRAQDIGRSAVDNAYYVTVDTWHEPAEDEGEPTP